VRAISRNIENLIRNRHVRKKTALSFPSLHVGGFAYVRINREDSIDGVQILVEGE